MNLIKKTTLVLGLLAATGTSIAQTTATGANNGLLGQKFAEFNYTLSDIDSLSDDGHTAGVAVNLPVLPSLLDVGGSYSYSWIRAAARGHSNTVTGFANAYVPLEGVKPFVGASLGYSWVTLPLNAGDDDPFWSVAVGFEIPLGALTVTPRITYSDDFNGRVGNSDDVWTYEVEGNYWFSPKAGAFASVARIDYHRDPVDIWGYRVGVRLKF